MSERFKASVQYGDWEGTAAADDADEIDLDDILSKNGLKSDQEFLLGIEVFIGENHGGKVESPYVTVLLVDRGTFDDVDALLKGTKGPVPVKAVDVELTLEEFFGLFKRFSVNLSRSHLNFIGREFERKD